MKKIKCEDCWAHYPLGFEHECTPWMKELVTQYKQLLKRRAERTYEG